MNISQQEFSEQQKKAIEEVKDYAYDVEHIIFREDPIPSNHLYCIRGKHCDYYKTSKAIHIYIK